MSFGGIDTGGGGFSGSSSSGASGNDGSSQKSGHVFNFGSNAGAGASPYQAVMIGGALLLVGLLLVKGRK